MLPILKTEADSASETSCFVNFRRWRKFRKKEAASVSRTLSSKPYSVYVNTLCGRNVEFVSVKPDSMCSNDCTLKGSTLGAECVRNLEYSAITLTSYSNCFLLLGFTIDIFASVCVSPCTPYSGRVCTRFNYLEAMAVRTREELNGGWRNLC
jgi:hypothetical protein